MAELGAEQIAQRVKDLPALPAVVTQVLRATRDPETSAFDVANVLATDQALTAKVLRLANSALFGFPRRIATLSDAIVLLGFSTLRSLVLAGTAFSVLNRTVEGYALAKGALWEHALATAVAAKLVCKDARAGDIEEAFVAGILHDVGKIVLSTYVAEEFAQILKRVTEDRMPFMEAEHGVLGFNHAEVGGLVAEAWGLPQDLCDGIRYHHEPSKAPEECRLAQVVHLGDVVALSLGIGLGQDGLNYPADPKALQGLGLAGADIERIMAGVPDALQDSSQILELDS